MPNISVRSLAPLAFALGIVAPGIPAQAHQLPRERFTVSAGSEPDIALQVQRPDGGPARADVVYVHGGTFGADLSIYFRFDNRSWADGLADAGFAVWGFDFVGFGSSGRYAADLGRPAGDIGDAMRDLRRVVLAVRQRNGNKPVVLLAHSRGAAVAARYAGEHATDVRALILFAPIVSRPADAAAPTPQATPPSHYPLSAWAQYRRFVEDVPKGQPQVLNEGHMQVWGAAFLASDPTSATRMPPSVTTPYGPVADIGALWSGKALYDLARVVAPTLIVRGAWDSLCTDADARRMLQGLAAPVKEDVKVPRATHLMHLEQQRVELYAQVNRFLQEVLP
jgi:pimeloyl-ACP methyl ester carboxylesterase